MFKNESIEGIVARLIAVAVGSYLAIHIATNASVFLESFLPNLFGIPLPMLIGSCLAGFLFGLALWLAFKQSAKQMIILSPLFMVLAIWGQSTNISLWEFLGLLLTTQLGLNLLGSLFTSIFLFFLIVVPSSAFLTVRYLQEYSGRQLDQISVREIDTEQDSTPDPTTSILLAAENGNASAQNDLSDIYAEGKIVPKDLKAALYWLEKAALAGLPIAQTNLGWAYMSDYLELAPDYQLAMEWNLKAASQGNGECAENIALLYENGWGVPVNHSEAANWRKKSLITEDEEGKKVIGKSNEEIGREFLQDINFKKLSFVLIMSTGVVIIIFGNAITGVGLIIGGIAGALIKKLYENL